MISVARIKIIHKWLRIIESMNVKIIPEDKSLLLDACDKLNVYK